MFQLLSFIYCIRLGSQRRFILTWNESLMSLHGGRAMLHNTTAFVLTLKKTWITRYLSRGYPFLSSQVLRKLSWFDVGFQQSVLVQTTDDQMMLEGIRLEKEFDDVFHKTKSTWSFDPRWFFLSVKCCTHEWLHTTCITVHYIYWHILQLKLNVQTRSWSVLSNDLFFL